MVIVLIIMNLVKALVINISLKIVVVDCFPQESKHRLGEFHVVAFSLCLWLYKRHQTVIRSIILLYPSCSANMLICI